ncbi:MAG: DUF4188 domain-containing protein [Sandaracinaceae bacterium]
MTLIRPERLTVQRDEGFVLFVIGARANHLWNLPILWAVGFAMARMMRELTADPESGLLSYENYGGRTSLMLQYWRSKEDLLRYAKQREREHVPAWRRWLDKWGRGAVGIYHETYVVEPGTYECIYHHMPAFGLGKVGPLVPAEGPLKTAAKRLDAGRRVAAKAA